LPEQTPKLGIKKPLGNETVSRAAFNENYDIIDQNAAAQADLDAHLADTAPHSATSSPTANRLVLRDSSGRAQFVSAMVEYSPASVDTPGNEYPVGISYSNVSISSGWPFGGTLQTIHISNIRIMQILMEHGNSTIGTGAPRVYFRAWHYERGNWANWRQINLEQGTGSPEGVLTANVGTIYQRLDGGAGTTLYVKESGTGNTGWVAK
jgi:hypothetical protein